MPSSGGAVPVGEQRVALDNVLVEGLQRQCRFAKAQLLIQNPIDCYLINSPMLPTLQKSKAGSLAIYIQKHLPGKDNESNGLAAPDGLVFLVMRLY